MTTRTFVVPGISCEHCRTAIESEVSRVDGVARVHVDIEGKLVVVDGDGDDAAIRAAIDEAGYDVT